MGKFDHLYKYADKELIINQGDPDLDIYHIPLPQPGDHVKTTKKNKKIFHTGIPAMDGYGKKPENQKWQRPEIPKKLKLLQDLKDQRIVDKIDSEYRGKTPTNIQILIWEIINENKREFKKEIEFITREWKRILFGYWCFINGKPTYIPGKYYFYLTYWRMDTENGHYAEYRDTDRKFFLVVDWVQADPNKLGFNLPKARRTGATAKSASVNYYIAMTSLALVGKKVHCGIQSMTDDDAEMIFEQHITYAYDDMAFWFSPFTENVSKTKILFKGSNQASKVGGKKVQKVVGSLIDFRASTVGAYDGWKLHFYHGDETGKTQVDVYKRHQIVRKSLTLGHGKIIVGLAIYTSTVGEMEKGGGANFKRLVFDSKEESRELADGTKTPQTVTGLINFFIPGDEGLEGFIDEFGNSLKDEARAHIEQSKAKLREDKKWDELAEETRMAPLKLRDCFRIAGKECNFREDILEERISHFEFGNKKKTRGNLDWENGPDSRVIWIPDERGRFYLSHMPHANLQNKMIVKDGIKFPGNVTTFVAGGDPFHYKRTMSNKKSKGGGAVFMRVMPQDLFKTDTDRWEGHKFICTYESRPEKNVYSEDMLKMCIFFGCQMFCEVNVSTLWDWFEDRGYEGYLAYAIDKKTGAYRPIPGMNTSDAVREEIYREYDSYISGHGMREVHDEILKQCLDIENDMGDYDLFVAGGYALLSAKMPTPQLEVPSQDMDDYFQTYTY